MEEKERYKIHLCKGCINELNEYNPYIDDKGNTIPVNQLDIEVVSKEQCDNFKLTKTKKIKEEDYRCDYCNRDLCIVGNLVFDDNTIGVYCSLECYLKSKGEPVHRRLYDNKLLKELRSR